MSAPPSRLIAVLKLVGRASPQGNPHAADVSLDRTGMFPSAMVSTRHGRRIALLLAGRRPCGRESPQGPDARAADLEPAILMGDALNRMCRRRWRDSGERPRAWSEVTSESIGAAILPSGQKSILPAAGPATLAAMGKTIDQLPLDPHREYVGAYHTARGRLAAFLTDLDPLFRRQLTGDQLHPFDNIEFIELDARGRRLFEVAKRRYFSLLAQVCKTKHHDDEALVNAEFLDNARREAILFDKSPHAPGAPKVSLGSQSSVRLSLDADRLMRRFKSGFDRAQKLKGRRGHERDTEIRKVLRSLPAGYFTDEIDAILDSASLTSAAARFLSLPNVTGKPLGTIRAAISRGQRLRRNADYKRRPRL
jgi:hypothetical protein